MSDANGSERSTRLVFAYDERGIRLVGTTARTKAPPRGEAPRAPAAPNAVTLDLRERDGSTRFRAVLRDPIPQTVEVFDDDGRPRREPNAATRGAFTAVVPAREGPVEVVIEAGPEVELRRAPFAVPDARAGSRRELARFVLGRP